MKLVRETYGLSAARAADPRFAARIRAALRADDLAMAIVDGPLDDRKLTAVERQRAALSALDSTFPLQRVTAELSLDEDVDSMSWKDMQRVALSLLG